MLKIGEWKQFNQINYKDIPKNAGIYEFWIKSKTIPNGKHYYGQAINLRRRFKQDYVNDFKDQNNPKSHNIEFNRSVKKHGTNNLYFRIRETICSYESFIKNKKKYTSILNDLEIKYIANGFANEEYLLNRNSGVKVTIGMSGYPKKKN